MKVQKARSPHIGFFKGLLANYSVDSISYFLGIKGFAFASALGIDEN